MRGEKVIVTIDKEGQTQISVQGVKGGGCKALTKPLEDALGVVTSDRPTVEFLQMGGQANVVKQS